MLHLIRQQVAKPICRRRRLIWKKCAVLDGAAISKTCKAQEASALNNLLRCVALWIVATVSLVTSAKAQDAEPRAYTNTPVGLNFLIAGYLIFSREDRFRSVFIDRGC